MSSVIEYERCKTVGQMWSGQWQVSQLKGLCVCSVGGRCVQEPCAIWVRCLCFARACMETMMLERQKRRHGGTSHEAWQTGTTKACDKSGQNKQRGAYLGN